ncbi:branched-chain amino acid aminotransferase [Pontibacter sp. G13]|uniref:branched-chain amino acid aminotransferase n=1 Tax=Pontibacter sp. G13 TaxID=3074898 RepID=UPI00288BDF39|nr:branched-chain amino acid aminotransferase [Pontibacter sp. G13]WNJ16036.1 branched-chain amino acid aminotransferase [Pontibacter sp. G13]
MQAVHNDLNITKIDKSKLESIDMNNIPFGRAFSDHMFIARFTDGKWETPEIVPYGAMAFEPSISALNYGQAIFEGMKAHLGPNGEPLLFRPEENLRRLNESGARLCMEPIPQDLFMNGLKALIDLDREWIPSPEQGSLYIRPLYFAVDEYIGVKASENYVLTIFTCPVGPYYAEPVNLLATTEFVRAAKGGTGAAKAAGNYAAALLPDRLAKQQGYHNVLWLDAQEHTYIEECGTMNVFFQIDDTIVVPSLTGTILAGITRHSVITLLKEAGYKVEERAVSIFEIQAAYREGRLKDAFGSGTAATITHIAKIGFQGSDIVLPPVSEREISNWVKGRLSDIKTLKVADEHGWVVPV